MNPFISLSLLILISSFNLRVDLFYNKRYLHIHRQPGPKIMWFAGCFKRLILMTALTSLVILIFGLPVQKFNGFSVLAVMFFTLLGVNSICSSIGAKIDQTEYDSKRSPDETESGTFHPLHLKLLAPISFLGFLIAISTI